MDERFSKILAVLKTINESLTREDFVRAFKAVALSIQAVETSLIAKIDAKLATVRNGKDGKDGKTPTKSELVALIQPLIPEAEDGETPSDEKLIELIKPLIPQVEDGEDGSPDTADDIRNKLELLPEGEKLAIDAIEGLQRQLDELRGRVGTGGGSVIAYSRGQIKLYDLSDQLDGVKKTFTLPTFWRVIDVQSTSTPNAFRPKVDYTTDASVPSIIFTSQIDAGTTLAAGQSLTILYAEP